MKRCPQCGREYDNTMMFCLDDGSELLYGPASMDEPATAILLETESPNEAATRAQIQMIDQTAVLPTGTGDIGTSKSFDKRLLLAPLALAVIVFGGFFGYRYITPAKQIESIAVMPFVNEGGNADVEYLADGMTETLINSLSNIPNLSVKASSTVFYYKGKQTSPKTIGEELKVQATLLGKVSQRGDDLRLSLELVNTETQDVIWGEQYDRKLSDLVSLQSEIAKTVSDKLRLKLSATEQERVSKTNTTNSEAQQLYLKGRFHWNKRNSADFQKAREYFQQAIAIDPNYALAYTGLADTLALIPNSGNFRPSEYMPLAKQAVQKALELDPNLAEAHASLGQILMNDYDFKGAERELKRAIELDPKYPSAHQWLAEAYTCQGNYEQALAEVNIALELDPLAMIINNAKGNVLRQGGGKTDEAIAWFKKTVELFPDAPTPRSNLAGVYEEKGMYPEAFEQRLMVLKRAGADPDRIKNLQLAYEKDGYTGFVKKQLEDQLDRQRAALEKDKNAYFSSYGIAQSYARLQDKDKTLEYLNKAYDQRQPQIVAIKTHPNFAFLRDDPRFKDLLKRMNLME